MISTRFSRWETDSNPPLGFVQIFRFLMYKPAALPDGSGI